MTYLTMYGYNFCWSVRTLRVKKAKAKGQKRTPAMAASLTDHVWTWQEWFTRPGSISLGHYHKMQYNGIMIERWEFEAQRSLIRNRHRLGIPNDQTQQTIDNLRKVYNGTYNT